MTNLPFDDHSESNLSDVDNSIDWYFIDDDNRVWSKEDLVDQKIQKYIAIKNRCLEQKLSFQFYQYNPIHRPSIPLIGNGCLIGINERALKILKIHDFKQLNQIMRRFRDVLISASDIIDDESDGYGSWLLSSDIFDLVNNYINSWVFEYEEIFKDGLSLEESKPHIFALLALYLIGSIANADIEPERVMSTTHVAVSAMEAICIAESLVKIKVDNENIVDLKAKFRKEQARKAALARHGGITKEDKKQEIQNLWNKVKNQKGMTKNKFSQQYASEFGVKIETLRKNYLQGMG